MGDVLESRLATQKNKPMALIDYNKDKISVDKSNQLLAYYFFSRRWSVNWWRKFFFHFFDLSLMNANIFHTKRQADKTYGFIVFLKKLQALPIMLGLKSGNTHMQLLQQDL
jgi:hypothetical protein